MVYNGSVNDILDSLYRSMLLNGILNYRYEYH